MNFKTKLQNLELHKKRFFLISLAIQAVLLLWGIVGLFGKDAVYEYGVEDMRANFGTYSEELGGYYVDASYGQKGNLVDFCEIALPRGVYSVQLHYETDTNMLNMCQVSDGTIGYKMLQTNGEHLYGTLTDTDFHMWLLQDSQHMIVHAYYEGEGSLLITGLTIRETNALHRIYLFRVIVGALVWNLAFTYREHNRKYGVATMKKNVFFGLVVISLFSSIMLMVDYKVVSGDLVFHLMRIEGIKDGLLSGQFPVKIALEWQQGYGYASSVFYGETLLYIAAFFRMIGFTVLDSYRMFFLVLNVLVTVVAYYCFQKTFKNEYIGLLCAAMYSLSIYRIYKTYGCGSFGEGFGVLFLPLIVYGFYRVFSEDIKEESYKRSWIPLCIGFTGLVQSHLLSGEMVGAFTILLCMILWKKVFRKETFIVLAKTVIYCVILSAWFLIPFADYMLTGDFHIEHVSARTIQSRGIYPAHLFNVFPIHGQNAFFSEAGMVDSQPAALGAPLLFVLVLWAGLWFFRKLKGLSKAERTLGNISFGFAALALLMSLSIFPWDRIQFLNSITQTLVSSLQFPNRFLTIANVLLTTVAGVIAKGIWNSDKKEVFAGFCLCIAGLLCVSNLYYINNMMYVGTPVVVLNGEGMGTGNISGAEYLPYGADATQYLHRDPIANGEVLVTDYEKEGLVVEMYCENMGTETATVTLPLLHYKGYQALDVTSGEELAVVDGENFCVAVELPAGYEGAVHVSFVQPWYWRVSEVASAVFFVALCVDGYRRKRKKAVEQLEGGEAAA